MGRAGLGWSFTNQPISGTVESVGWLYYNLGGPAPDSQPAFVCQAEQLNERVAVYFDENRRMTFGFPGDPGQVK